MTVQLPLFLEEHVLLNSAMQDMNTLRLEEAKAAFTHYRELYPNGECVITRLKLTDYLMDGLAGLPGGAAWAAAPGPATMNPSTRAIAISQRFMVVS